MVTPLLILLAATASLGLFLVVKDQLDRRRKDASRLVAERLQPHLGSAPVSLRDKEMQETLADRVVRPLRRRAGAMAGGLLVVGVMLGNLVGGGQVAFLFGGLFLVIGYVLPGLWLRRLAAGRVKEIREALPAVLDLPPH